MEEFLVNEAAVGLGEFGEFEFGHVLAEEIEAGEPLLGGIVPAGEDEGAVENHVGEKG